MKHTNATYENIGQLISAHGENSLRGFAREAYDRTECGVWTTFLTMDESIPSSDLTKYQDKVVWGMRHCVGVKFGTIVEGSDAEFEADALLFPFTDEELADAWQYLEELVNEAIEA